MTSYRFHFRQSSKAGRNKGALFIRVIHGRRYKDIRSGYKIYPDEWNSLKKEIELPDGYSQRKFQLIEWKDSMRSDIERLYEIVNFLNERGEYSVQDVYDRFNESGNCTTVLTYSARLARELQANDQPRTARAYRSAAKSIVAFNQGADLLLTDIRASVIRTYEQYLFGKGLQMNTVAFYMRNLRAIYYRAIKAGLIANQGINPFGQVFTGVYPTRRRALESGDINRLTKLERSLAVKIKEIRSAKNSPTREYLSIRKQHESVMYFLFSYHSRGMSFIDLAYLKKSDAGADTLIYKRKKTGSFLEVKITKPMKRIIEHFRRQNRNSAYLFPIIEPGSLPHRRQYETGLTTQNKRLKEIREMAGLSRNLSTHVARHTWATTAKRMGYSVSLISEGLGHRDPKVTTTYLDSFERCRMDEMSVKLSKAAKAA